jgi:hypothetical protein
MRIKPSNRTATIAGAWSGIGFFSFAAWSHAHPMTFAVQSIVLYLVLLPIFLFLPFMYFVNDRDAVPFKRNWFRDPVERARYASGAKRMFVWFISCVTTGLFWLFLLSRILPGQ